MKKYLALLLAAILLISLFAGCGSKSAITTEPPGTKTDEASNTADTAQAGNSTADTANGEAGDTIRVLGCVLSMDHTFQQQLALGWGIEQTWNGEPVNIELSVADSHGDVEKELQATENYLDKGIDAWVGYPLNADALANVSKEMIDEGIIVITEGNNMKYETMGMVTDERDGGLMGGEMFVNWWNENRPDEDPYILVLGDPDSEAFQRKPDAFVEYVTGNMANATIVGEQDSNMNEEDAMNIVSSYITSNPKLNFVFCGTDADAIGAMAAIEASGRTDIAICGCGGEDSIISYLYEPMTEDMGGYAFEVAYGKSAIELGFLMMEAVVQVYMDPATADYNHVDLGFTQLTRENVDEYVAVANQWRERVGLEANVFQ